MERLPVIARSSLLRTNKNRSYTFIYHHKERSKIVVACILTIFQNNKAGKLPIKINNPFHTKFFDFTNFQKLLYVPESGRNLSTPLTIHLIK